MSDTIGSTSAPTDSSSSAGKCPVDLETRSLWSLLGRGRSENNDETTTVTTASNPQQQQQQAIPASLEEAARHAQTPHASQRLPLSTHRLESTIPRSSTESTPPAHQIHATNTKTTDTWVYPSEQQVFNAMKRKGWKGIEEESIPSFLQIHNSVNERSWREVQQWEERAGIPGDTVELSRFEGRPKDLTPKAWFLSTLGIRDKPFDRHDWYVVQNKANNKNDNDNDNTNPTEEKRYVLDFYMTDDSGPTGAATGMPWVEIDVRPALDSPGAVLQRGTGLLREAFPGIARELDEMMTRKQR